MIEDGNDVLGPRAGGDPAAIGMALGANPETVIDARAYLREQTELARLQKANLLEQNAFELSHLRWRRFNDQMKGALQIMVVLVGVVLVIAISAAVWQATQDNSLVIDSFSVPPDLALRGWSGQAMAARLLDDLQKLQFKSFSSRARKSYRGLAGDEIKLEIPDTGISLGDIQRTLRAWLGHQTHISGELRREGGKLELAVRFGDRGASLVTGGDADVEGLVDRAAERVYGQAEPYRYANYLRHEGRIPEALALLEMLAISGDRDDRLWALQSWAAAYATLGRVREANDRLHALVAEAPGFAQAWLNLSETEYALGHNERALTAALRTLNELGDNDPFQYDAGRREANLTEMRSLTQHLLGDFAASAETTRSLIIQDTKVFSLAEPADDWTNMALDLSRAHDLKAARQIVEQIAASSAALSTLSPYMRTRIAVKLDLVRLSLGGSPMRTVHDLAAGLPARANVRDAILVVSSAALALAEMGDVAAARHLIGGTAMDCDPCLRARGNIEEAAHNPALAAHWFDLAVRQAPSTPFAYTDWGAMLLHKGDYDAAVAKFTLANQKGPHFADPLEMWGEALIAKNRSDLALAKFEEANRSAPNWGRLHLKWGEALGYVGRKDEARAQYRIASTLDLSVTDKAKLARDVRG